MTYKINFERYAASFCLPQSVVGEELASMDSVTLKVALLIFRNADKQYSANLLANLLNVPESKINDSLSYWIERGLLLPEGKIEAASEVVVLSKKRTPAVKQPPGPELSFLLECMERELKRPVTSAEYNCVVHILEYIRLPADVVIMAIDYCINSGKFSARYLEKLCASWADSGITTHERAEQYLRQLEEAVQQENAVKKLFGIENRSLIDSERKLIARWYQEYRFTPEIIKLAYERTITAINKLSFPYINAILESWHKKGYTSPGAVMANEGIGKKPSSSSYDMDELEEYWRNNVPKL